MNNVKTQVKAPIETVNTIKPPVYQPNASFSSKKSPAEEGLKLPKVTSTSASLVGSVGSVKTAEIAYKKTVDGIFRTGSRESGR